MIHETKVTFRASAFTVYYQVKGGWIRMKDLHFQRRYMRKVTTTHLAIFAGYHATPELFRYSVYIRVDPVRSPLLRPRPILRFRQSDLCVLLDFDRYLDNLSQLVRFAYMAFFSL
jgi:hypothetical protein